MLTRKHLFLLIISSLLLSLNSNEVTIEKEDGVLVLTDENYDFAIKKYPFMMIDYYAPWCGHCKKLAPEYSKAAEILKNGPAKLAKVDCTKNKQIAQKLSIRSYPTIIFNSKQERIKYSGKRTAKDISDWIKEQISHNSKELKSTSSVERVAYSLGEIEICVVFFGDKNLKEFLEYTKEYSNIKFYHCISKDCYNHFKVKNGSVMLFRKFGTTKSVSIGPQFSSDRLRALIYNEGSPKVDELGESTLPIILVDKKPVLVFFYNKTDKLLMKSIAGIIAHKLKSEKLPIFISGVNTISAERKIIDVFNLRHKTFPLVAILDSRGKNKVFEYTGEIDEKSIIRFVKNWQKGKIDFVIKSEAVVAENKSNVVKIVGNNYDKIVNDTDKDVIVLYTTIKCESCVEVSNTFTKLASHLNHVPNLVFGEIEMSKNDIGLQISSYPTIYFWPKKLKRFILFSNKKTLEELIKFVEENLTDKTKTYKRVETIEKKRSDDGVQNQSKDQAKRSKYHKKDDL